MYNELFEKIKGASRIIIHRHTKPDGDALGAQIGLRRILEHNFPDKEIYTVGDAAGRYAFIEGSVMDEIPDELYADALAIVLDTSARALISDGRFATAKETARMDHHIFVEKICDVEVTDTSFESCCGLVAAKALYTGMITDSGRFRYDSTTAKTFRTAAFLMEQDFSTADIYSNLYSDDLSMVQLRARFVLKIQTTDAPVAYIYTTKEEVREYGVDTFTVSRGMVNTMGDLRGVHVWVNFTETEDGVLAELRSSRYNINPIAVKYGGGGHAKASGATLKNREEAMAMLEDLKNLTKETV